jgi:hypothetical protein
MLRSGMVQTENRYSPSSGHAATLCNSNTVQQVTWSPPTAIWILARGYYGTSPQRREDPPEIVHNADGVRK